MRLPLIRYVVAGFSMTRNIARWILLLAVLTYLPLLALYAAQIIRPELLGYEPWAMLAFSLVYLGVPLWLWKRVASATSE